MGYIDCDTHIWENDATWSYLSEAEQQYKPVTWETQNTFGQTRRLISGVSGWTMPHGDSPLGSGAHYEEELEIYPLGTRTLTNTETRLKQMDQFGVDVQVCHPTGWGTAVIDDPREEIALTRSYNRWMADATAGSNGRLRWQVQAPMGTPEAAGAELKWGKEHGAIGVHLQGLAHHKVLTDPSYFPVWEQAQDLDMVCLVHVGSDRRRDPKPSSAVGVIWNVAAPVVGAMFHHLASDMHVRFPRLKWIYVECGSMWVPWIYQQYTRAGADLWRDVNSDWTRHSQEILAERNIWVTAEQDDDLPYVVKHMGDDRLTLGSDYGHFDMGTDPEVHNTVMANQLLPESTRRKITNDNARELFGIEPTFTPSDQANLLPA
jgi:predicted TIM-barrel fold metal-dependent hydrolase